MAGTDKTQSDLSLAPRGPLGPRPAVILMEPQLGENIGTTARAMYNFGLADLRLVAPRDGWPNARAVAAASGATVILDRAEIFADIRGALGDLTRIYATTARPRELNKPVLTPAEAAAEIAELARRGTKTGLLFGGERAGLTNDQLSLADRIISIPVNPAFASLNLAQAVLLTAYEWSRTFVVPETPENPVEGPLAPAKKERIYALFDHLEAELDRTGFLYPPEKAPAMIRNIRSLLLRADLTDQDVRTLRGMIKSLTQPRARGDTSGDGSGDGK